MPARSITGLSGLFFFLDWDATMAGKKPAEPTPESIARANRQRLAAEEGARALLDFEQKAVAVRKNMERLRALREAKQVEDASNQPAVAAPKKKRKEAASSKAASSKTTASKAAASTEASGEDAAK
jgi:hypothetical protein